MISAPKIRRWLSWLFLATAVVTALVTAPHLFRIVEAFGSDFPRSLSPDLPAFSEFVLGHEESMSSIAYLLAFVGVVGGILIAKFGNSPDTKAHSASLVALAIYHVLLTLWVTFVIAFFLLPKLKAGI